MVVPAVDRGRCALEHVQLAGISREVRDALNGRRTGADDRYALVGELVHWPVSSSSGMYTNEAVSHCAPGYWFQYHVPPKAPPLSMIRTPTPRTVSESSTLQPSQVALPEAVPPGHPEGATLPPPAPPDQHQPQARSTALCLAAGRSGGCGRRGGAKGRWHFLSAHRQR